MLIAVLLDPVCDLQFGSSALRLDIVILLDIDLPGEEIKSRLVLGFLRLVGPEVLDLALFCAVAEASYTCLVVLLRLRQSIKLFLLRSDHFARSLLETLEQVGIVLLGLVLVVGKLQLHTRCIVRILFDSLVGLLLDLMLKKECAQQIYISTGFEFATVDQCWIRSDNS